jgi:hypothetical protein
LRKTPIFRRKLAKIAENWQKSPKIVVITSTPGFANGGKALKMKQMSVVRFLINIRAGVKIRLKNCPLEAWSCDVVSAL